jgi:hypothetical protein
MEDVRRQMANAESGELGAEAGRESAERRAWSGGRGELASSEKLLAGVMQIIGQLSPSVVRAWHAHGAESKEQGAGSGGGKKKLKN